MIEGVVATPQWYGTQAGVIAASMLSVSIIKRVLGNTPYANTVPTWVYAVSVTGIFTFIAVHVLQTLPGDLLSLMSQTIITAASTSGFYEWMSRPAASLAVSAIKVGVPVEISNLPARDVATQKTLLLPVAEEKQP